MVSGLFEKKEGTIYVNAASSGLMSIPAMKAAEGILKEYKERAELTFMWRFQMATWSWWNRFSMGEQKGSPGT